MYLISSGNCWNPMEADFLRTGLLAAELLASFTAFMLAWLMSLDTAVKRITCKKTVIQSSHSECRLFFAAD